MRFIFLLSGLFFLTSCGLLNTALNSEQGPALSVMSSTDQLFEGQQARIKVLLSSPSKENVSLSWAILNEQDSASASTSEIAEVRGTLVIPAGAVESVFYVTSLPASLSGSEKKFRLEISGNGTANKIVFPFVVLKNLGTSAVSITTVANNAFVNKANSASYAVSGVCSHAGANVVINTASVTKTEVCSETLSWSSLLDLRSLSDGALALTVSHGPEGGTPATASRILTKDTVDPSVTVTSPSSSTQVSAGNAGAFALAGDCSESGRSVQLSAESDSGPGTATGTGTCSAGHWNATLNLEFLANGNVTVTVAHQDAAGNTKSVAQSYTKDAAVPVFTIAAPVNGHIYNSTTYTQATVSGLCDKPGATVTLSGAVSGTTSCDGSQWRLDSLTVAGADGDKMISAAIVDSAGNSSSLSVMVKKYTSKPTASLINGPAGVNNATTLGASVLVPFSANGKYKYKMGDQGTTGCADSSGYSDSINASVPLTDSIGSDGGKRLCVVAIDDYGNQQDFSSATSVDWTKDTVAPAVAITSHTTGSFVNIANQSAFTLSGTCAEVGRTVTVQGSAPVQVTTCSASHTWSVVLNFSAQSDGIVGVFVSQSDAAGNVGQDARYFNKDTQAPALTLDTSNSGWINRNNRSGFVLSGTCSDYSSTNNIIITGADTAVSTTCNGAAGWSASVAFTGPANGGSTGVNASTRVLTVQITDEAGNSAQTQKTFNIKTTEPSVTLTNPLASSYVNDLTKSAVVVDGTCSDPGMGNILLSAVKDAVTVTKVVDCAGALTFSASGANSMNLASLSDGDFNLSAQITDIAGNQKTHMISMNKKTSYPVVAFTTPVDGVCVGPGNKTNYALSGTCGTVTGDSGTVTISSAVLSSSVTFPCSSGVFSGTVNINDTGLNNGDSLIFTVSQSDVAGNIKTANRTFKYLSSGQTPSITFGGWEDVYAVGVKTYADGTAPEVGVVRFKWKEWPGAGNTCQPEAVQIYRSASSGNSLSGTKINSSDILSHLREFKDETLAGSTPGTVSTPTDFGKAWYYGLKVKIAGVEYAVDAARGGQELRIVAPPANMALVHRWVANQEMCGLLGRTVDKNNNYRCNYSGWGRSYGDATKFDMEYDLLVDRFELACNYTMNCGPSGNQACVSGEFPNDTVSTVQAPVGAVFYYNDYSLGQCYIKTSNSPVTWVPANSLTGSYTEMSTNMAHKPALISVSQTKAADFCGAYSVPLSVNGSIVTPAKRLLRNKEWKVTAAWPSVLTDTEIVTLENGGMGRCNSSNRLGLGTTGTTLPGTTSTLYAHGNTVLVGTKDASSGCQSRYGVQDMVGNVWEWASDQLSGCTSNGLGCVGAIPSIDAGNTDMKPNGAGSEFKFDHTTMGPGGVGVGEWNLEAKTFGTNYFSLPLGLPLRSDDGGNALLIDTLLSPNKLHSDRFYLYPDNGNTSRGLLLGGSWNNGSNAGRWASHWHYAPSSSLLSFGLRCAVPLQ